MKYCEGCHALCSEEVCGLCGSAVLREVREDDYCFLIECNDAFGDMLKLTLAQSGIKCVLTPFGDGMRSALGLSLGNYAVYVPYARYEEAQGVLDAVSFDPTEELREMLLENEAKWHAKNESALKKMKKKLALAQEADFMAFIKQAVLDAEQITDDGPIGYAVDGGRYITVRIGSKTVWFNSLSYEIFM